MLDAVILQGIIVNRKGGSRTASTMITAATDQGNFVNIFGQPRGIAPTMEADFGQWRSAAGDSISKTGLYYCRSRYYNPYIVRFMRDWKHKREKKRELEKVKDGWEEKHEALDCDTLNLS
jgi:hypothetical protein